MLYLKNTIRLKSWCVVLKSFVFPSVFLILFFCRPSKSVVIFIYRSISPYVSVLCLVSLCRRQGNDWNVLWLPPLSVVEDATALEALGLWGSIVTQRPWDCGCKQTELFSPRTHPSVKHHIPPAVIKEKRKRTSCRRYPRVRYYVFRLLTRDPDPLVWQMGSGLKTEMRGDMCQR